MKSTYSPILTVSVFALMVLSACGGGGGSGATSAAGGAFGGAPSFAVGGTVSGLGASTTLLLNGDTSHAITQAADGSFTFSQPVAYGASYTVTVGTQPTDLKYCQVSNGTGTVTAAVSNVTVSCATGNWVVTEIATSTDTFPADPVLDPVNAANNVGRAMPTVNISTNGYVDIHGNYYFSHNSGGTYYKITGGGVKTSFVIANAAAASNMTGDSAGNVYIASRYKLFKISTNGTISELCPAFIDSFGLSAVKGIVLDEGLNTFYAADNMLDKVLSINPTSCVVSTINNDGVVVQPSALALDASNNLYVGNTASVYTMNKATGVRSAPINGTSFSTVSGMVFDPAGYLYLSSGRSPNAYAMASNGTQILLASGVSTSNDQNGIGRNANGDIYLTLRVSRKIIKLSRP